MEIKSIRNTLLLSSIVCLLSACSTWNKLDNTEKGAVIGGGSGAALGSAVSPGAGTVIGGALGAVGGGVIGNEMDKDEESSRRTRHDRY